ncbi:MFS transporter [Marispirochaeta sp.]|jgi:MFS family permease|uniref:MFS transporter n=1 Tax=Marispirochaeta sp. TaxID=2038653 RepID=UPI0029C8F875|nr:MFS transporter [Marispirochaeta sp.]
MPNTALHPHLRRNFFLNALDGISFLTGMIFLSPESILPVYIERLGGSPFVLSLIPVLRNIGVFFPSIFVARYIQTLRYKKPYILITGAFQRVPWLLAALSGLALGTKSPAMVIVSLMLALFITQATTGIAVPAFFDLTAKSIPINLRGRLFAIRNLGSYLIGLACGGIIIRIMNAVPFPNNFPLLMIIGFSFLMIYLPALGLYAEPPSRRIRFSTEPFGSFLTGLARIPRENRDFGRYIIARIFYTLAFTSYSYFAVHLVRRFSLHESEVGLFTIITAATFIIANPVLGELADRRGHLFNHILGALALIIGNLAALFAGSYHLALISIAAGALTLCINNVSQFAIVVEFGQDHEIPVYIGIVGLAVGISSLVIIFLGYLSTIFGIGIIFWFSLGAAALSLGIFATVTEPRKHRPPTIVDAR